MHKVRTQISLCIHTVLSECLLNAGHTVDSQGQKASSHRQQTDQTEKKCRLINIFAAAHVILSFAVPPSHGLYIRLSSNFYDSSSDDDDDEDDDLSAGFSGRQTTSEEHEILAP